MKKIYLAGPMTGYENLNFPLFDAETARLRALGYEVANPAEINPESLPEGIDDKAKLLHWRMCMRADIGVLVTCDAIALLPGWEDSPGATLEHHIASKLGFVCASSTDISSPA